jgi:bifunctional non-homologous end joining protein LigD
LLDERGLPDFESMRGRAVRKSGAPVTYFAFDLLFLNGRDLRPLPLIERKTRLRKLIPKDHPRLRYVDHIEEKGEFVYRHAVANELEGVVGKRADSLYVGRTQQGLAEVETGGLPRWMGATAQ